MMAGPRVTLPAKVKSPVDAKGRPRGGGRPTLCTKEEYGPLLGLLRMGLHVTQACQAIGISRDTVHSWIARGREGEEPYAQFREEFEKASAQAEMAALADIRAGKNNWQSRAWFLERRFRDRWGRNDKLEIKPLAPERVTAANARRIMTELFPGDVTPNEDVRPVFSGPKTDDNEEP